MKNEGGILRPGIAIATEFRGTIYRSRLEANVAQFLADLGLKFQYEAKSFLIGGKHYAPDFYLPEMDWYVEARGYETETSEATLEAFAREHGDLAVFYFDRAEHIRYWVELNEVNRDELVVLVCDYTHVSLATFGYPAPHTPRNRCWYCVKCGVSDGHRTGCYLNVEMRSGVPILVTDLGKHRQE